MYYYYSGYFKDGCERNVVESQSNVTVTTSKSTQNTKQKCGNDHVNKINDQPVIIPPIRNINGNNQIIFIRISNNVHKEHPAMCMPEGILSKIQRDG